MKRRKKSPETGIKLWKCTKTPASPSSRLLSAGCVPTISTRRRKPKPSLRCPPTQQQTHIPLPASYQYRSTHLLAYGAMEVRPTMTRIPAHRPTCTHTASKHRDAQRTSSSSTKTVLRNRLHTHQPWPTPLALLQRDQTTPPKPPSKTDAATSPILRFQRARTCARTPLAPPPAPPGLRPFWRNNCMCR